MTYRLYSPAWLEETSCTCGAGHGSGEAHTDWCHWTRIERFAALSRAAAELLASPALHKVRVQGKMMTKARIVAELGAGRS